ncbi:helix-turn-helix transcriptional regulator [Priestia megaterium]|uniref:helix-turn-helix transcriptional regulator n=1 Tax=Priestia megaterium TaxID=1404 RepID=UPI000BF84DA7|nr:helix-turn-helix transcriptional regulator [Priestia megaterium]PFJ03203.1 transcriptional regulator [Priestia megaterium]PGR11738.1 transcriptional regulator [Priestia megaterium]
MLHCHLREIINDKGLKQMKLAEKMGVSKQTMSAWVNGRITPTLEAAYQLADLLDCPITDLWTYEKET